MHEGMGKTPRRRVSGSLALTSVSERRCCVKYAQKLIRWSRVSRVSPMASSTLNQTACSHGTDPNGIKKESKRLYLDSLRGMAAVIVVCTHFVQAFYPFAAFGGSYRQQSSFESFLHWPPFSLAVSGHFAVCLFFVLSGFVLAMGHLQSRSHAAMQLFRAMIKRPIRLGGMVAFSAVAGYALHRFGFLWNEPVSLLTGSRPWFSSFWTESVSVRSFAFDIFFGLFPTSQEYNPPMWSIHKELQGSYIVFLYLLVRIRLTTRQRIAFLAALFLLLFERIYVGFVIGLAFAELDRLPFVDQMRATLKKPAWIMVIGLLVGMQPNYLQTIDPSATVFAWKFFGNFGTGGFAMLGASLVFASVLLSRPLQATLDHRLLRYIGSISYAMYAMHFLLLGSLTSWLYLNLVSSLGHFASFVSSVAITFPVLVALSHVVTNTVDRRSNSLSNWLANKCLPDRKRESLVTNSLVPSQIAG
jgi:peptidoglycan/LPS O-acetylase OafA/YrhL